MLQVTYSGARLAAPRLVAHFARHIEKALADGRGQTAAVPDEAALESIIDAAFWASLRREEGYVPTISMAYLPPDQSSRPLLFASALSLSPSALAHVAPAVERPGIHLGVWRSNGELSVWGTTRAIPTYCFVLEVSAPGLLIIKHHRGEEASKYVNVAVLEGDIVKMVDETASSLPDCPPLVTSLLGFTAPTRTQSLDVLVELAVSMRAHKRGGALLVVPADTDRWKESIVWPMQYAVTPSFAELFELLQETPEDRRVWQEEFGRAVETAAGLTAVDGATIMSDRYEILGFGAKIARRRGSALVESVTVTEPIEGAAASVLHPSQLGGTRHLSAAQFVHDQQDALALVASQDGRFTIFAWSPCEGMVHAHRVEALLL
jgi:hypothetical protein